MADVDVRGRSEEDGNPLKNEWGLLGARLLARTALHPLDYARTLIQIGYEPMAPRVAKNLFGKEVLRYPNVFQYIGYIKRIDGFSGCFRGATPRIIGGMFAVPLGTRIADCLGLQESAVEPIDCDLQTDDELYAEYKLSLKRRIVVTISDVIISQPFQVVSLRMMAQFIGKETAYEGFFSSVKEIYKTDGILGFFSGLVPSLLFEVGCVVCVSSAVYLASKYWSKDKFLKVYFSLTSQYMAVSWLYPLHLVSTCTAVSSTSLLAGRPPITPIYSSWINCFNDMSSRGELSRGSNIFIRNVALPKRSANYTIPLPPLPPPPKSFSARGRAF